MSWQTKGLLNYPLKIKFHHVELATYNPFEAMSDDDHTYSEIEFMKSPIVYELTNPDYQIQPTDPGKYFSEFHIQPAVAFS